ncbi:hypothetical protein H8788_22050 [Parabacteroides faecis]|nr:MULTISPECIES: hypothetical protein [Parabacteroides]MBC8620428.1 hypothetical protein [Parabacteroides faecis]
MNIYYDYVEEQALITHSVAYYYVVRMLKQINGKMATRTFEVKLWDLTK